MHIPVFTLFAVLCLASCSGGGDSPAASTPDQIIAVSPASSPALQASPSPDPASPSPSPAPPPSPQALGAAGAPASAGADLLWGANGHPFSAYPDIGFQQQLDTLVRLGLKQYRINLQPDGSINNLETMLGLARERGITILPIVFSDVSFDRDSAETIYARSRTIAETLARRFAGRIPVWELGNEFENYAIIQPCEMRDDGSKYPCEWGAASGIGPSDYYGPRWAKVSAALRGLSDGIRAGDPSARRAIGTAGWGHVGAFERMKADGVAWDISVWHEYGGDPEWAMKILATYGKPIWITEFGGSSVDGEDKQAQHVRDLMLKLRTFTKYGVASASVYELLDEPYWSGYEAASGIVHLQKNAAGKWSIGADKPAGEIVRSTIAAGP